MAAISREAFDDRGFLEPTRVFSARECAVLLRSLRRETAGRPPTEWVKGWGAMSPAFAAIAADDRLLDLITPLLGEDVMLWGASLVVRRPHQVHPWHTDIESSRPEGGTVSIWIGLAKTTALSSLIVVPGSHRFGLTLQEQAQREGARRDAVSDEIVGAWARTRDHRSGVVALDTTDGDAIVFDGRLWHASHNRSRTETRYALLLQYARPDTPIRIPNFARLEWPFELYDSPKPPCILVSGQAPASVNGHAANGHDMPQPNRIVPPPASPRDHLAVLHNRIDALQLPLAGDPERGFKPHPLFRGSTPGLGLMGCHVSVLDPGRTPHPPHRHDDEEILIVLDGEAELIVEYETTPEARTVPRRAHAGDFAYYPAGFLHTIRNVSDRPVTYLMFKWIADRKAGGTFQPHALVSTRNADTPHDTRARRDASPSALRQVPLLDGETAYLRHLHAHLSLLPVGGGYAPHVDAYDVAIVVLDGTIETLDQRVGPHGVIFCPAGEPHGMKNGGSAPARYLVFEFHGRRLEIGEPRDYYWRLARRVWAVLRDPARLRAAVAQRLRARTRRLGR